MKLMNNNKDEVLGRLIKAIYLLESSKEFSLLMPEVRVNIVYSTIEAKKTSDVAAVDGRITVVNGFPKASGLPKFGASDHMARAILEIRKYQPNIRAGINFRYNEKIEIIVNKYAKENSLTMGYIDRKKEPDKEKKGQEKSMPWKIKYLKDTYGKIPDIFYESSGWGKEPLFVVIGQDPIEISKITIKIASMYNESETS